MPYNNKTIHQIYYKTMNRFVSNKTHRITLPNQDQSQSEDWVEVKTAFTFEEIIGVHEESATKAAISINLLKTALVSWNLKDEEGNEVPLTEENIRRLEMVTVTVIMKELENVSNLKEFKPTGDEEEDKKKLSSTTVS